jgi:hypothetical protein
VQDAAAAAAAETLGAEDRRLVEKMVLDGKRNGLALPADAREKLTALRTELSGVQLAFSKNMNEEDGHVALSAAELVGVPPDVVAGYPKRTTLDGTEVYDVPFKTTDIFPVLKQAVDPAAREKASTAYEGRLAVNTPLLARAIALRREIAGLLGYATWADYQTEPKMVKTGKGVADVSCPLCSPAPFADGAVSSWTTCRRGSSPLRTASSRRSKRSRPRSAPRAGSRPRTRSISGTTATTTACTSSGRSRSTTTRSRSTSPSRASCPRSSGSTRTC